MDTMTSTAVFFATSILLGMAAVAVTVAVVVINNIIAKYWKPVNLFSYQYREVLYSDHVDQIPKFEDNVSSSGDKAFTNMTNTLTGAQHGGKDVQNGTGTIDRS